MITKNPSKIITWLVLLCGLYMTLACIFYFIEGRNYLFYEENPRINITNKEAIKKGHRFCKQTEIDCKGVAEYS